MYDTLNIDHTNAVDIPSCLYGKCSCVHVIILLLTISLFYLNKNKKNVLKVGPGLLNKVFSLITVP